MIVEPAALAALVAMGLATYATRAGGFWLMGFVPLTPRVEAALTAIPSSVMASLLAPIALQAGPAEMAGYAVIAAVMLVSRRDIVAGIAGIVAVAAFRNLLP